MLLAAISHTKLSQGRRLGGGAFGEVYAAVWNSDTTVATKVNSDTGIDQNAMAQELSVLAALPPHANVVTVFGVCVDHPDGKLRVVMEYCAHGSVHDYLVGFASAGR